MKKIIYVFVAVLLFSSCGVKYKTIPYFTDLPISETAEQEIKNKSVLKIQKDDILAITVSSLNEKSDAYFNFRNIGASQSTPGTVVGPTPSGYIVDQVGTIQLPYLGSVMVEGLSTNEARLLIQSKLDKGGFLIQPIVNLRLVNFKISVLGDVIRPGVYPVQNERITVTEALALAGDLNITALRNNVLLIRETKDKRQQVYLDLQSKELFSSPYYYLHNNDVLIITPGPAKYASVDSSYRNVSLIIAALSVIALLITRI